MLDWNNKKKYVVDYCWNFIQKRVPFAGIHFITNWDAGLYKTIIQSCSVAAVVGTESKCYSLIRKTTTLQTCKLHKCEIHSNFEFSLQAFDFVCFYRLNCWRAQCMHLKRTDTWDRSFPSRSTQRTEWTHARHMVCSPVIWEMIIIHVNAISRKNAQHNHTKTHTLKIRWQTAALI